MGKADHQHRDQDDPDGVHLARRGSPAQAARMLRQVIARDDPTKTAHQTAATTPAEQLSPRVAYLVTDHEKVVTQRHVTYQKDQRVQRDNAIDRELGLHRTTSLGLNAGRRQGRDRNQGYDLSL